jgi:Zn-dependent protease
MTELCINMAHLSLLLFFFNLLPIPPLDGSRVARVLIGMSYEAYYQLARYGFIILILVMQVKPVMALVGELTNKSAMIMAGWFGLSLAF